MTQSGTPVQAHPTNAAATQPTNPTTGHEQPRPSDTQTAHTAGSKTDTETPPPPKNGSVVINVQGATFVLPTPDADVQDRAAHIHGHRILQHHHAHPEHTGKPSQATRHTVQFSRVEVERIALADASGLRIPEEQIKRDITH